MGQREGVVAKVLSAALLAAATACHDGPAALDGSVRPDSVGTFRSLVGRYSATPIATVDSLSSVVLNDGGQVAGVLRLSDGSLRTMRWTAGRIDTLQSTPGQNLQVTGIDNAGNVVGSINGKVARWPAGSVAPSLLLGADVVPLGIGVSSGGTILVSTGSRYFVLRGETVDTVQDAVASGAIFRLVDDAGDVAGNASLSLYPPAYLRYADGVVKTYSSGRGFVGPAAINNHGVVIGAAEIIPGQARAPVRFDSTTYVDLRTVYGSSLNTVYDINDDGWMIGKIGTDYRLLSDGNLVSVDSLLADSGLHVSGTYALSNSGQILATVKDAANVIRYTLLTPKTGR